MLWLYPRGLFVSVNVYILLTSFQLSLFMLDRALTNDLLTAVMQTLRQHTEVWAGLNAMKRIVTALFNVHCTWKNRGIQSRALLSLLLELDGDQCLDPAAREQVLTDQSVFTHVSPMRSQCLYLLTVSFVGASSRK